MKNKMNPRYMQLLIAQKNINEKISNGAYKSLFAGDICKLIQKETERYSEEQDIIQMKNV